jgi:hypothetical protein
MMVVIESSQLSNKTELKVIEQHAPSDMLIKVGVAGRPDEVEAVASLLPGTSIVHFARYGTQYRSKPLDSGLKLNDGLLRISRIMKETITNISLAFLIPSGDRYNVVSPFFKISYYNINSNHQEKSWTKMDLPLLAALMKIFFEVQTESRPLNLTSRGLVMYLMRR